jgi:ribosomal protein L16/L10AE
LMTRMGKGVGSIKNWISYIKKGTIFLEIININKKSAINFFKLIVYRLPLRINFIIREVFKIKTIA